MIQELCSLDWQLEEAEREYARLYALHRRKYTSSLDRKVDPARSEWKQVAANLAETKKVILKKIRDTAFKLSARQERWSIYRRSAEKFGTKGDE